MSNEWNQAVDSIYRGEHRQVSPEAMKTIGTALLRAEQNQTPEQISAELDLTPNQVRELVIRAKGWEFTRQQERQG